MFRFKAFGDVGFFDPEFFLYYEEVDLMRRFNEAQWRIIYEPRARILHEEGAATRQFARQVARQRDPSYLYHSWRHYFTKSHGRMGALVIALLMLPAALLNVLHRGLRGKPPTLPRWFFVDHVNLVITPLIFGVSKK